MIEAKRPYVGIAQRSTGQPGEEAAAAAPRIFGFWIFLMSDLVVFSLLLATYGTMVVGGGAAGHPGPEKIAGLAGPAVETALLLASSFAMSMMSIALKYDDGAKRFGLPGRMGLLGWMGLSALLGLGFLAHEAHDFARQASEGLTPQLSGYWSSFYALVGTHGLHVSAGLLWMAVMAVQVVRLGVTPRVRLRLMRLAIYWHMLDIVWIAIFTFVYLGAAA